MLKRDLTRGDFDDWMKHPVTELVFLSVAERIRDTERRLGAVAGEDPREDRKLVGTIAAYFNLLNIDFEEVTGG